MSDCCGKEAYQVDNEGVKIPTDGATRLPRDAAFRWRKYSHFLAIDHSGHLWSRGPYPGNGRVESDGAESLVWKKLSDDQWLDVHVTDQVYTTQIYYALKSDGSIYCWGGPPDGDSGPGMGLGYITPGVPFAFTPRALISSSIDRAYPISSSLSDSLYSSVPATSWSSPTVLKHELDDPGTGATFGLTLHYGFTFAFRSAAGSGYTSSPQVLAVNAGETIEPVSVSFEMRYAVHAVVVSEQTAPYRGPVSVIFPPGISGDSASATCVVDGNGFISAINVTNGGQYDAPPTAKIVGTGGNAKAEVTPNGSVFSASLQSGGRYTNRDLSLQFSAPQLPGGVAATMSFGRGMVVADVQVLTGGSGYTSPTDNGLQLVVSGRPVARLTLTPSGVTSIKRPSYTFQTTAARRRIPAMQQIAVRQRFPFWEDTIPSFITNPTYSSAAGIGSTGPILYLDPGPLSAVATYELRFAGDTREPVALVTSGNSIMSPVEILDYTSEPYVVAIIPETVRPYGLRRDYGTPDDYIAPLSPTGFASIAVPSDLIFSSKVWCGPGVSAEANEWSHGCWEVSEETLLGGSIIVAVPLGEGDSIKTKANTFITSDPYTFNDLRANCAVQGNAPSGWVAYKPTGMFFQHYEHKVWHDFHFVQTVPSHEVVIPMSPLFDLVPVRERRNFSAHLYGNESTTDSAEIAANLSEDERTLSVSLVKPGSGYKAEPSIQITYAVLTPTLIGTGFTSMAGSDRPGLAAVKGGNVYACGFIGQPGYGIDGSAYPTATLKPVGRALAFYDPDRELPSNFGITSSDANIGSGYDRRLIDHVANYVSVSRDDVFGGRPNVPLLYSPSASNLASDTYGSVPVVAADSFLDGGTIPGFLTVNQHSVFAYARSPVESESGPPSGGRYNGNLILPQFSGFAGVYGYTAVLNAALGIYDSSQAPPADPKGDYLLPPGYPVFVLRSPDFLTAPQDVPFGLTCQLIGPSNAVRVRRNPAQSGSYLVDDSSGQTWSLFSWLQGHAPLSDQTPYRTVSAVTSDSTLRSWDFIKTEFREYQTNFTSHAIPGTPASGSCGTATDTEMGVGMRCGLTKSISTTSFEVPHATGIWYYIPPAEFLSLSQESKDNSVVSVRAPALAFSATESVPGGKTGTANWQTVYESAPYTGVHWPTNAPGTGTGLPTQNCPVNWVGRIFLDFFDVPPRPTGVSGPYLICPVFLSCEYSRFEIPVAHSDTFVFTRSSTQDLHSPAVTRTAKVGKNGTIRTYPVANWSPVLQTTYTPRGFSLSPPTVTITTPSGQVFQCVAKFLTSPLVGPLNNLLYKGDGEPIHSHHGIFALDSQGRFLSRYGQKIRTATEANTSKVGIAAGVTKAGSIFTASDFGGYSGERLDLLPTTVVSVDVRVTSHGKNYDLIPYYDVTPPTDGPTAKVTAAFDGKVIAVAIESEGSGFSSPPVVTFSGGNGSGATAVAVIEGGVGSLAITSPGSGYFLPPSLRFNGTGIPATGRCSVDANGNIVSAAIESPGVYRSPPTVEIIPDKWLTAINVSSGGAEYSTPPTVSICGTGNGRGAAAFAKIDGAVVEVEVVLGGRGYSPDDPPEIVFTSQSGATAARAEAVLDPETGAILSVTVTSGGSDYQFAPTVLIQTNQGAGAMLKARIAGPVSEVTVTQKGEGYATTPVVLFQGGGGTGASATAVTEAVGSGGAISATINGKVKYIRVTNEGSMYDFPPEVIVTGGGNAASDQAAAAKSSGEMTREQYESSPAVCVAKAIVEGTVTSFSVVSGGSGYAIDSTAYYRDEERIEAFTTKPPVFVVTDGLANSDKIMLGAPDIPGGAVFANGDTTSRIFRRKPRVYAPDDVIVEMDRETFSWTSGAALHGSGSLVVSPNSRSHSGLLAGYSFVAGESDRFSKCCVVTIDGKTIQPALLRRGDARATVSGVRVDLDPVVSFASAPTITLRDAAGSGAVIQSQIDGQGILTGATFSSQGTGYTSDCYLEITAATIAFEQCQATAVVSESGSVSHVVVSDAGKGYISPVAVVHNGRGSGCVVAVHLETGIGPRRIACIEVLSGGSGYRSSSPPEVYVYDSAPDFLTSEVCKVFNAHLKRNGRLSVNFTSAVAEYINRNSPNAWEIWKTPASTALMTEGRNGFFTINGSNLRAVATVRLEGIESLAAKRPASSRASHHNTLGIIASPYAGERITSVAESSDSGCRPHEAAQYAVSAVAWREASLSLASYYVDYYAADRE